MNESGEHMLNRWFALEPVCDEGTTGQQYEVPRDVAQPMSVTQRETPGPAEVAADVDAKPASGDGRVWVPAEELVPVGGQSDGVVEKAKSAEAQDSPLGEHDVTIPSYAVARLLEIATASADSLVEKAREEADQLQTQARARAEQILHASIADAQAREASISAREEEQRLGLEASRAEVEERVGQLLEFEGQLRTYLISYFNEQKEMLHRSPVVTLMATAEDTELWAPAEGAPTAQRVRTMTPGVRSGSDADRPARSA
jgi:vacuolar-type H+-ATPase subunit H